MKLIYHEGKNFGDALNPIIFNHYIPELLNPNSQISLLGIGSILGLKQNIKGKKVVFSSGYAAHQTDTYGKLPKLDKNWDIICVRGPLTAKALGIEHKLAVADGAILIPKILPLSNLGGNDIGFMPHHKSMDMFSGWPQLCKELNISLISPSLPPLEIINKLSKLKLLITEAMHGAIVADAYRIPWMPVKLYPFINEFKWNDWGQSVGLETLKFHNVTYQLHNQAFLNEVIKNKSQNLLPNILTNQIAQKVFHSRIKQVRKEFASLIKNHQPQLSPNGIIELKQELLIERFQHLKKMYGE